MALSFAVGYSSSSEPEAWLHTPFAYFFHCCYGTNLFFDFEAAAGNDTGSLKDAIPSHNNNKGFLVNR